MKWDVVKDKKVYCTTTVPYPPEVVQSMKKHGYKVKEVKEEKE